MVCSIGFCTWSDHQHYKMKEKEVSDRHAHTNENHKGSKINKNKSWDEDIPAPGKLLL